MNRLSLRQEQRVVGLEVGSIGGCPRSWTLLTWHQCALTQRYATSVAFSLHGYASDERVQDVEEHVSAVVRSSPCMINDDTTDDAMYHATGDAIDDTMDDAVSDRITSIWTVGLAPTLLLGISRLNDESKREKGVLWYVHLGPAAVRGLIHICLV
jgi:hypothetical protein